MHRCYSRLRRDTARNSNNYHRGLEPMTIFSKLTRVVIVSLTLAALSACGSGSLGPSGTNGTNGTNGVSGTNGLTALDAVVAEPPGKNCTNGGNRITSGLDTNANGV